MKILTNHYKYTQYAEEVEEKYGHSEERNARYKKKPCETLKNEKYIWNENSTE